jgi:hypothetical protein
MPVACRVDADACIPASTLAVPCRAKGGVGMARISTSGSPWAIVFLGAVMTALGVLFLAAPDAVQVGEPAVVGTALLGGGPAIAAFGAGAVRRMDGRFGGRGWSVVGFGVLAITSVAVGIRAGDGVASAAGLLGIVVAGLCVVTAGVTISRGVLARRMSASDRPPVDSAGQRSVATPAVRSNPAGALPFDLVDVDAHAVDAAHLDDLRRRLPAGGVRLLHLWVFDERTNDGLIDLWRTVGPVQLLRGGGALGGVGTLVATITGRVGDLIEETAEEVHAKLAAFDYERREDGRFAVNTILCGDRTWRVALDELIATTDVVQMDLGGFDEDNRGCTHELGVLIDRVALDRVLLVAGDSTDVVLLRRVLEDAWDRIDANSPNRDPRAGPLLAVRAPLVGAAPGPDDTGKAARIERQELAVFGLMLERAGGARRADPADTSRTGMRRHGTSSPPANGEELFL